jgi:glycerol-3-phosphate dehydrogenase
MKRDLASLDGKSFDLLVIGGGIVGAAIARDATRRGLTVALVERDDFACATSEAMSHMVHGGIRYLATGDVRNVRESLRERAVWRKVAPHKIEVIDCLTPVVGSGVAKGLAMRAAVAAFNALGGRNVETGGNRRSSFISTREAVAAEPAVAQAGLEGALTYLDCRVNEPERVVLALLQDAAAGGATIANHVECVSLGLSGGAVRSARLIDRLSGAAMEPRPKVVVNAAGGWADALAARLLGRSTSARTTLSKGVHLFTEPIAVSHAINLAGKGEHAVVMPWRGMSLIGTTDDRFDGDPSMVTASDDDIERLKAKIARLLPGARIGASLGRFAALRALPGSADNTYRMSRDTAVVDHARDDAAGLLSVFGGKWTTARHMAETAVDRVVAMAGVKAKPCDTAEAPLGETPDDPEAFGRHWRGKLANWPEPEALLSAYGSRIGEVAQYLRTGPFDRHVLERARFAHASVAEMAVTPADFERRLARWHAIRHPGVAKRAAEWMTDRNAPTAKRGERGGK